VSTTTGRAEENDVVGFVEEVEVGDLGGLDGALEREAEVIDRCDLQEPGALIRACPPWVSCGPDPLLVTPEQSCQALRPARSSRITYDSGRVALLAHHRHTPGIPRRV
jgi:hypothetical protein